MNKRLLVAAFIFFTMIVVSSLGAFWLVSSRPVVTWDMVNVNYDRLQGDAHVLQIADTTVLIDAGYYEEAKQALVPFLQKHGIKHIDYFFISHPHRDHYEGAIAILEAGVSIGKMFFKEPSLEVSDCCYSRSHLVWFVSKVVASGTRVQKPNTGFKLDLPLGSSLEVLHAQEGNFPTQKVDVNDLSMVMRWSVYGRKVLFTGDLNKTVGQHLASDQRMQADILKIPHHGGRGIVPNAFYQQVMPKAALVSGPEWIWCGERGEQSRRWLQQNRVPTWVNGLDGDVRVSFSLTDVDVGTTLSGNQCSSTSMQATLGSALKRWPSISEVIKLFVAGVRSRL